MVLDVSRDHGIELGGLGSSGMGAVGGDPVPSTELAAQLRIATEAFSVPAERKLVADMAAQQLLGVTAFLTNSDSKLQRIENFGSSPDGLQSFRSVAKLDAALTALNHSCAEIMLESDRLGTEVIPMLASPQSLSGVLTAVNDRAEAASLSTMRAKGTWREQVFEREVLDIRVARVQEGVASVKRGMEYSLRQHGIDGEALTFIAQALSQRVDELAADVIHDPVKGNIDLAAVRARQDELRLYERVSVPREGSQPLVVELSQALRDSISARYGSLADAVERKRVPPVNTYLPAPGVSVTTQTDPAGKGLITFSDDVSGSTVVYTIGDKNPSAYGRVQTLRNIEAALATTGESAHATWDRSNAESVHAVLMTIADGEPRVTKVRLPVPAAVAGFTIEDPAVSPVAGVLQPMIGTSAVTLRQQGVAVDAQHRIDVRVEGHNLTVALKGPRHSDLKEPLDVSVTVDMDRLQISGQSLQAQLKLVAEALSKDPASCGILRKEKGLINAMLEIPGAQVSTFKGVLLEKGADRSLKLAADARVLNVRVSEGATLRYENDLPGAVIEDSRGNKGSTISYRLSGVTLIDCHNDGMTAGSIAASKLVRTEFLGAVQQFISGELGTVGQPITDDKCTFDGCEWRIGKLNSFTSFGKKMILALT